MMGYSTFRPLAICLIASVALAGCQSSRLGALETRPNASAPAPINAAPTSQVTSSQLPPPVQPDAATQVAAPTQFPQAPAGTQVATAPTIEPVAPTVTEPSIQNVSTSAPVTKEALVGAWKVSTSGSSCQMFMALTKWSGGFRAASRGCPGDAAAVTAWNVSGNQVVLSDTNGNAVATLFSTGSGGYNGQTKGGSAISLSR